eukprot:scaffold188611_cov57-Attheya_sp.AAC.1
MDDPMLSNNTKKNATNTGLITIAVKGRSFLYRQVRNIVACLVSVGNGTLSSAQVKDILDQTDPTLTPPMIAKKYKSFAFEIGR